MKTVIAVVACAVAGFAGLQGYFWATRSKEPAPEPKAAAEAPKIDEEKPIADEEPPPPPRPKKTAPTTSNKATTTAPKHLTSTPAQTKPRPKATKAPPPSTDLYFTTEGPYQKGIPSSVTIHNTPFGTFKILMLRSSSNTGELFAGRGTKKANGKDYAWEVEVRFGNVRVTFDGKNVPGRSL
jgi:hypothetical protein